MSSSRNIWMNLPQVNKQSRIFVKSKLQLFFNIFYSIDYLDKTYGILSEEPMRADSMIFSASTVKLANERTLSSIDSLLSKDMHQGFETKTIKYFYFYKQNEAS